MTLEALAIFAGAFLLRAVGVSVIYHRYFAHRSYRASRAVQFLLGLYGALTVMGGVLWWAQTHRQHHRHADTPDDIHSPYYQGFFYAHCGWFLTHAHRRADLSQIPDLARFPELVWLERWDVAFKLAYIGACWLAFGVTGLVWGFFVPTVLVLHMVHWIQSVSHSLGGYRRYPIRDNSRNHWLFGVLSLGEGFHHNHHCFPYSARIGLRWWELDAGYAMLRLLSLARIVSDLRVADERGASAPGSTPERHIVAVRSELRELRARFDGAIEEPNGGEESAQSRDLRMRVARRIDALDGRVREELLRGASTLDESMSDLRLALRTETHAALPQLDPATRDRLTAWLSRDA